MADPNENPVQFAKTLGDLADGLPPPPKEKSWEEREHDRVMERVRLAEEFCDRRQAVADDRADARQKAAAEIHLESVRINAAAIEKNTAALERIAAALERR